MLVTELLPFIKNLSTRKWSDEEIPDDLAFLKGELTKSFESLS
jgi:V-type H+-transporting ATPase subunit H